MRCSLLKKHLFDKNLIESPLCECGKIETSKHYVLECHMYSALRYQYILPLPYDINMELLLYGNPVMTDEQNKI